jgi:hypothetical protein
MGTEQFHQLLNGLIVIYIRFMEGFDGSFWHFIPNELDPAMFRSGSISTLNITGNKSRRNALIGN